MRVAPSAGPLGALRTAAASFGAARSSVRAARTFLAAKLAGTPHTATLEASTAAVAELASNALCHTASGSPHGDHSGGARGGGYTVVLVWDPLLLRVTVADLGGDTEPVCADPGVDAESGQGLLIVQALTSRWGWYPTGMGINVWFECDQPGDPVTEGQGGGRGPGLRRSVGP